MKLGFNQKTLAITLAILITIEIICLIFLSNIDKIINGDLYNYGLQFDIAWAYNYWLYKDLALISVITSIALSGTLISILLLNGLENYRDTVIATSLIFLTISFLSVFSIFLMSGIDNIVNYDLKELYNIEYHYNWTSIYYLYSRLFYLFNLISAAIAIPFASWALIKISKPKLKTSKILSISFIITGAFIFSFSIAPILTLNITEQIRQSLSLTIIIGLGLILCGIIVGYITSTELIQRNILTTQQKTTYNYLEEKIKEKEFKKAIYLPKNSNEKDYTTLILENKIKKAKTSKNILIGKLKITPPGNELAHLIEKNLNTNFTKIDLTYLYDKLPKTITENLELSTEFKIKNTQENIIIKFENSIFSNTQFNKRFFEIIKNFGCPISSAIASIIATSTGKQTIIQEYQIDNQNKITKVTYKTL
ncbi:MAG: hypothetical protein AC479_07590 [miscellaneous Crenarchaeota group-6 archaeon AD8-1]|nr:MAG: hypothetical protein AC479_07590 [miscellaneous Crenarchaeota group-6 archaeon AD8-1]